MTDTAELRRLLGAATEGPWDIWEEKVADRDAAAAALVFQARATPEPFPGVVYLLNAGGLCPATTGCGPTSKANADLITAAVNALPDLLDELDRLRAQR